jgi:hypothetical protein
MVSCSSREIVSLKLYKKTCRASSLLYSTRTNKAYSHAPKFECPHNTFQRKFMFSAMSFSRRTVPLKVLCTGSSYCRSLSSIHTYEHWMIYGGPGFVAMWFGSSPTLPTLSRHAASCLFFSLFRRRAVRAYWRTGDAILSETYPTFDVNLQRTLSARASFEILWCFFTYFIVIVVSDSA